jgi:glycosyltransferase involved in cell wall biosynthesis
LADINVLLVNVTFGRLASGSGQHVYMLWSRLKDRVNFEVWSAESVGYINVPKLRSISFFLKAKRRGIPKEIDIVHIHNPKFAALFEEGKKNVLTMHGDYEVELKVQYGPLAKPIIHYIDERLKKANVITTVSPYWSKLRGWVWIPNMVELPEIGKISPSGEEYVLFVGRDDPVKNYPLFRNIAEKIYKALGLKSLALGTVRGDTEFLKHAKVPWEVVISYMKSAVALVITSKQEGLPTVLLEAWASGCPVLAYDIPPMRYLNEMYGTPLIFNTVKEAVEIISKLPKIKEELVKRGSETVKNFDAPKVAEQYYNLYRSLIER